MYVADKNRYSTMEYLKTGESGLKMSALTLGLWHNFGTYNSYENMKNMLFTAFDNGITCFDLANNYGPEPGSAESNFGKILHEEMLSYRDEMVVITKAGYDMWEGPYGNWGSRKYLIASLDQSLKRMGLDYVDIFYHHRMDLDTPLEETMGALASIVKSGKALYVGLSNYDGENLKKAAQILKDMRVPFIVNQNRYNMFDRTVEWNGLLDESRRLKKGVVCFSPLAQGMLTDRYINGIPEDSRIKTDGRFLKEETVNTQFDKIFKLNEFASERGEKLSHVALKWLLKDSVVSSVIIGASKPEQILDNLKALDCAEFSDKELAEIDKICV